MTPMSFQNKPVGERVVGGLQPPHVSDHAKTRGDLDIAVDKREAFILGMHRASRCGAMRPIVPTVIGRPTQLCDDDKRIGQRFVISERQCPSGALTTQSTIESIFSAAWIKPRCRPYVR